MLIYMKKSLVILTFVAALFSTGNAFAADNEPVTVSDAGPRILELINRERAAAGLAGLALDQDVTAIALRWSREMALAGRLSHNDDYLSAESMDRLDATTVGENVAVADSVDRIHALLMDSPPHRANILNADFRLVGVGAVRAPTGELYLTEDFLTRRASSPAEARPAPREHRAAPSRPAKPARRGPAAKRPRARAAAAPATRPAASSPPTAPPASPAPPAPPAPPSAPAPEAVAPVDVTAPEPVAPLGDPEAASDAGDRPEATAATGPEGTESDAVPVEAPALDEAAQRGGDRSAGDLVKGVPALLLLRRRWLGRRH